MDKPKKAIIIYKKAPLHYKENLVPSIISIIIFSKFFYNSNHDLKDFTKNYLKINYKEYVFKSRTLLYSRIIKDFYIHQSNTEKITTIITKFLDDKFLDDESHNRKKKNKQSDVIGAWRKIINPDD